MDKQACALFAEITHQPDSCILTADGQPDYTGLRVTVRGLDKTGMEFDIIRDAALETAKLHCGVGIQTEPADPRGLLCRITFSVYSSPMQQEISASVMLLFAEPAVTKAPSAVITAAATTAQDGISDSFTPCTAKPEDDFSDWHFHIVIKHQYSSAERQWTLRDFDGIANIRSITQYDEQEPYRQLLDAALAEPSKEGVLEIIRNIESRGLAEIKEIKVVQDR